MTINARNLIIFIIIFLFNCCTIIKSTKYDSNHLKNGKIISYYYLPKCLFKIKSNVTLKIHHYSDNDSHAFITEQSFNISKLYVPDTNNLFVIHYFKNILSKDELTITTNSMGLLEKVSIHTEDRLPKIIDEISKAPSIIFATAGADKSAKSIIGTSIKNYANEFYYNPTDSCKQYIYQIAYDTVIYNKHYSHSENVNFTIKNKSQNRTSINKKSICHTNGIFTLPIEINQFEISPYNLNFKHLGSYTFFESLPSPNKLLELPLSRAAFSARENHMQFSNGLLVEHISKKASELEGFISIPINIAKLIVSVPAQIFSFKYENIKHEIQYEEALNNLKSKKESNNTNDNRP